MTIRNARLLSRPFFLVQKLEFLSVDSVLSRVVYNPSYIRGESYIETKDVCMMIFSRVIVHDAGLFSRRRWIPLVSWESN